MKKYIIPNFGTCIIYNIFLDLNGTINYYGKRPEGIKPVIEELKKFFNIYIVSANTRGDLDSIANELGVDYLVMPKLESEQDSKLDVLNKLDPSSTIAIGNGNNDVKALKSAKIGIAVIGKEGASINAINAADLVVTDILDAFRIILDEQAMIASLRI